MHSVDDELRPVAAKTQLDHLSRYSFICHHCERIFAARSDELYYFVERDFTYHRHGTDFYRALEILDNGAIRISSFDSVEENVLQVYRLDVGPPQGDAPNPEDRMGRLKESSRKFFESMKRQKRQIVIGNIDIRIG